MAGKRFSPLNAIADSEEKAIERAVQSERQLMQSIYGATAGRGVGEVTRKQKVSDELLGMGDPATVARVREYGFVMSTDERRAVNRRATRAGGAPIFDDADLVESD